VPIEVVKSNLLSPINLAPLTMANSLAPPTMANSLAPLAIPSRDPQSNYTIPIPIETKLSALPAISYLPLPPINSPIPPIPIHDTNSTSIQVTETKKKKKKRRDAERMDQTTNNLEEDQDQIPVHNKRKRKRKKRWRKCLKIIGWLLILVMGLGAFWYHIQN
jgi:hypothetical protein